MKNLRDLKDLTIHDVHPIGNEQTTLKGYLAHKKQRPPRTLLQDYSQVQMVALGGGKFLMSELPL